ncbi:MAG: PAS domain-containing protein [Bacteroidota bacterium]
MNNPTMNNQLSIKNLILRYWHDVSDWFTSTSYFNEDSFITRLRYFQITSFSFLFVASFLNFLGNSGHGYIITSAVCMALIVARFLIDSNREKKAYVLMLTAIYAGLISLTLTEGLRSGIFLLFLPVIISFSFLTDLNNKKDVRLTYLTGIGSFLIAVIIAPDAFAFGDLTNGEYTRKFFLNTILSVLMVAWMSYALARENNRRQNILRNKEVFLATIFNSSLHTEIIVDAESGRIFDCNEHAASLFAAGDTGLLHNKPASELFFELQQKENQPFLQEILNPIKNWKGELTCVRIDGTVFPASTSFVTFKYHDRYYKKNHHCRYN